MHNLHGGNSLQGMNVATMYHREADGPLGGSYLRYWELIRAMAKEGIRVKLFSSEREEDFVDPGIELIHPAKPWQRPSFLRYLISLWQVLLSQVSREGLDACYAFSVFDGLVCSGVKLLHPRTKVVVAFRGDSYAGYKIRLETEPGLSMYLRMVSVWLAESFIILMADKIIFNTYHNLRQFLKRHIPRELHKAVVIHNNARPPPRRLKGDEGPKWSKPKDSFVILYLGGLWGESKGLFTLFEAFAIAQQITGTLILLIVGEGPDRLELQKRAVRLSIDRSVVFLDWSSNPSYFYKLSDLVVCASVNEGFSNLIAESLYLEVPILVSDHPPNVEAINDLSLTFKEGDSGSLASQIIRLASDKRAYSRALRSCRTRKIQLDFDWCGAMLSVLAD